MDFSYILFIFATKCKKSMSKDERATEFAVFCLENTAKRIGANPRDVFLESKRTDVLSSAQEKLSGRRLLRQAGFFGSKPEPFVQISDI